MASKDSLKHVPSASNVAFWNRAQGLQELGETSLGLQMTHPTLLQVTHAGTDGRRELTHAHHTTIVHFKRKVIER